MKRQGLVLALAASLASHSGAGLVACVGGAELREFHLAVCEHYHVPESTIVVIRKEEIPDDDLPVVLFISEQARVTPSAVVVLRKRGMSWMDVALHFKLTAEVFHVHFDRDPGPPYGVAHGYYKNRKRSEWAAIRLADADVVHLVNVKFLAARYACTPGDVVKFHAEGKGYVDLHVNLRGSVGKVVGAGPPGNGAPGKGNASPKAEPQGKAAGDDHPKKEGGRSSGGGRGGGKGRGR